MIGNPLVNPESSSSSHWSSITRTLSLVSPDSTITASICSWYIIWQCAAILSSRDYHLPHPPHARSTISQAAPHHCPRLHRPAEKLPILSQLTTDVTVESGSIIFVISEIAITSNSSEIVIIVEDDLFTTSVIYIWLAPLPLPIKS